MEGRREKREERREKREEVKSNNISTTTIHIVRYCQPNFVMVI